jgi:hypothetical protein
LEGVLKGVKGFFGLIKGVFTGGWGDVVAGIKGFVGGTEGWFQKFVDWGHYEI